MASLRVTFSSVRDRVESMDTAKRVRQMKRLHLTPGRVYAGSAVYRVANYYLVAMEIKVRSCHNIQHWAPLMYIYL